MNPNIILSLSWSWCIDAIVAGTLRVPSAFLPHTDTKRVSAADGVPAYSGNWPVIAVCTCALDLARCDVVLHGARRFHPQAAWRGFLHALRRPPVLIRSMLFSFGQWACVAGIGLAAVAGLHGGPAIWLARALAVASIVLGLARLAIAVEAGPPVRQRTSGLIR